MFLTAKWPKPCFYRGGHICWLINCIAHILFKKKKHHKKLNYLNDCWQLQIACWQMHCPFSSTQVLFTCMQPKPVIGQKNSGYRKKPRKPLVPVILSLGYTFIYITVVLIWKAHVLVMWCLVWLSHVRDSVAKEAERWRELKWTKEWNMRSGTFPSREKGLFIKSDLQFMLCLQAQWLVFPREAYWLAFPALGWPCPD